MERRVVKKAPIIVISADDWVPLSKQAPLKPELPPEWAYSGESDVESVESSSEEEPDPAVLEAAQSHRDAVIAKFSRLFPEGARLTLHNVCFRFRKGAFRASFHAEVLKIHHEYDPARKTRGGLDWLTMWVHATLLPSKHMRDDRLAEFRPLPLGLLTQEEERSCILMVEGPPGEADVRFNTVQTGRNSELVVLGAECDPRWCKEDCTRHTLKPVERIATFE